jgi:hypothetical protein
LWFTFLVRAVSSRVRAARISNIGEDKKEALAQFEELIKALVSVGLETEVRQGEDNTLLVFVKESSKDHLNSEVYRSRYAQPVVQ